MRNRLRIKKNATEKDFRKKLRLWSFIAPLHEIGELNLSNRIMVWLFKRDVVTFEIHAQHKQVSFM